MLEKKNSQGQHFPGGFNQSKAKKNEANDIDDDPIPTFNFMIY